MKFYERIPGEKRENETENALSTIQNGGKVFERERERRNDAIESVIRVGV